MNVKKTAIPVDERGSFFWGGEISHLPFLVSGNFESSFYPRPPVRMLQPHMLMNEPIASRSHFSIQFDEEREKFQAAKTGKMPTVSSRGFHLHVNHGGIWGEGESRR